MPQRFSNRVDESYQLNPGVLRHQITWERKNVTGQNTYGEDELGSPEYHHVLTCRAQVRQLVGRELERVAQKWADAKYQIKQHYSVGLTPKMRISWYIDGSVTTLDVLDVQDPPGTGRYQIVIAKDFKEED